MSAASDWEVAGREGVGIGTNHFFSSSSAITVVVIPEITHNKTNHVMCYTIGNERVNTVIELDWYMCTRVEAFWKGGVMTLRNADTVHIQFPRLDGSQN